MSELSKYIRRNMQHEHRMTCTRNSRRILYGVIEVVGSAFITRG